MKKTFVTTLLLSSLFSFISVLSGCAQPKWYETRKVPGISKDEFFLGFGEGASLDDAVQKAQNELASQLTVTVKSETNLAKETYSVNEKALIVESFQQEIQTTVNKSLTNVQIDKSEHIGDSYYALVSLNKEEYFKTLKRDLDKQHQQLTRLNTNFDRFIEAGRWPQAFERLREAYNTTGVFEEKKAYYLAIAQRNYENEVASATELKDKGIAAVQGIQIELISGGNQQVFAGDLFSESIIIKLSQNGKPVGGMNVNVSFADGELFSRYVSDENGIITLDEVVAKPVSSDKSYFVAQLSPAGLPEFARETVVEKKVSIPFSLKSSSEKSNASVSVQLVIQSTTSKINKTIENKLLESIQNQKPAGFTISDNKENAIVTVEYTIADKAEIEGMQQNLQVVKITIQLRSSNLSSEDFYNAKEISISGLGNTEELATLEALKKLQIPSLELAKLFRILK